MAYRGWHWPFMLVIKQALIAQLLLKLLKFPLQGAKASLFHMLDNQLIFTAPLIEPSAATHQDLCAITGLEIDPLVGIAKHSAAHLGLLVLQAEIPVTRGRAGKVGYLAFDP